MKKIFINIAIIVCLLFCNALTKAEEKAQNLDFGPYMRRIQRQIKGNWSPPTNDKSLRTVVLFKVNKDGTLASQRIFKSSGKKATDDAALLAIKNSAPFMPLPKDYKGKSIDIQFTFDYNVWGSANNTTTSQKQRYETLSGNIKNISYYLPKTDEYKKYENWVDSILAHDLQNEKFKQLKWLEVSISINRNGEINAVRIERSSGDKGYDAHITDTIKKCSFPQIPATIDANNITMFYQISSDTE